MQKVTLDKIEVGIQRACSGMLMNSHVDISEIMAEDFRITLRGFLLGERVREKQVARYPRDWKEAFKARWFPSWLLARYPVVYEEVRVGFDIMYPEFKYALPDQNPVVEMYVRR